MEIGQPLSMVFWGEIHLWMGDFHCHVWVEYWRVHIHIYITSYHIYYFGVFFPTEGTTHWTIFRRFLLTKNWPTERWNRWIVAESRGFFGVNFNQPDPSIGFLTGLKKSPLFFWQKKIRWNHHFDWWKNITIYFCWWNEIPLLVREIPKLYRGIASPKKGQSSLRVAGGSLRRRNCGFSASNFEPLRFFMFFYQWFGCSNF